MQDWKEKSVFGTWNGESYQPATRLVHNTDRFEHTITPYLPDHLRKVYAYKGVVLYHLNQLKEEYGIPNTHQDAFDIYQKHYHKKNSSTPKSKKEEKEKEKEREKKYPGSAEHAENALHVRPQPKDPEDKVPEMEGGEYVGQHPFRMMVTGDTGSGKTTVLVHMVNHFYAKFFDKIVTFAGTLDTDPVWKHAEIDKKNAHEEYDEKVILEIRKEQQDYIKQHGIRTAKKILIIIDDMAARSDVMKSRSLLELMFQGRKESISLCLLTQKYNKIDKPIRVNMSHIIVFASGNDSEQRCLQEEQRSPYFPSGRNGNYCFDKIYRFCTLVEDDIDDHPFLVIDHQTKDKRQVYRKRLFGVITLKVNPATQMVDCDFSNLNNPNKDLQTRTGKRVRDMQSAFNSNSRTAKRFKSSNAQPTTSGRQFPLPSA